MAAGAVYLGVQLLLDIWIYLVIVGVVLTVISGGVALWRSRSRGW